MISLELAEELERAGFYSKSLVHIINDADIFKVLDFLEEKFGITDIEIFTTSGDIVCYLDTYNASGKTRAEAFESAVLKVLEGSSNP